jgi:hypothetical protein
MLPMICETSEHTQNDRADKRDVAVARLRLPHVVDRTDLRAVS